MKSAPCGIQCPKHTTRRHWLKRLALSCGAFAALRNSVFTLPADALDNRNKLRIDLSLLPTLELNGGSAMLTYDSEQTVLLVNRESETDYYVLDPRCTHQGCRVDPYSSSTSSIICPCHGSEYSISGQVTQGPAVSNLNYYNVALEEPATLAIEIGGFFHHIESIALHSTAADTTRLRITFPTIAGGTYALRHAPSLDEAFVPIGFRTSPSSPTVLSQYTANGATASLYVDASGAAGFFKLELLVFQIG